MAKIDSTFPLRDASNSGVGNAVFSSQRCHASTTPADSPSGFALRSSGIELPDLFALSWRQFSCLGAMLFAVAAVLYVRGPSEVRELVVVPLPVEMSSLATVWTLSNERHQNKPMNVSLHRRAVEPQADLRISAAGVRLQLLQGSLSVGHDLSAFGGEVAGESGNWFHFPTIARRGRDGKD